MAAVNITNAVLIGGNDLRTLLSALRLAQRVSRNRDGYDSPSLARLAATVQQTMSAAGHADSTPASSEDDGAMEQQEYVTTTEAASQLGCTARTVRRYAAALGGRRLPGGQWLIPAQAINDHLEGSNND